MTDQPELQPSAPRPAASPVRVAVFTLMALFVAATFLFESTQPKQEKVREWSQLNARYGRLLLRYFCYIKGAQRTGAAPLLFGIPKAKPGRPQQDKLDGVIEMARANYEKALASPQAPARYAVTLAALDGYLDEPNVDQRVSLALNQIRARAPNLRPALGKLREAVAATTPDPKLAGDPALLSLLRGVDGGELVLIRIYDRTAQPDKARALWQKLVAQAQPLMLRLSGLVAGALLGSLAALTSLVLLLIFWRRAFIRRARPAAWGLGGALETLILWFFLQVVFQVAAGVFLRAAKADLDRAALPVLLSANMLASLLAICWFRWAVAKGAIGGWFRGRPLRLLIAIGSGALILSLSALITIGASALFQEQQPGHPLIPILSRTSSPFVRALFLVLVCLVGPAVEEILFRGILFSALRRNLPFFFSALLSGVIFGLLHVSEGFTAVPTIIFLGFAFAALYEYSGSLIPPILVHAAFNTLAVLALYLFLLS